MKKLNIKTSKCFLYILLVMVFMSCEPSKQTLGGFCGGVVYQKGQTLGGNYQLTILKRDTISFVCVYDLDFKRYQLGDTINCK